MQRNYKQLLAIGMEELHRSGGNFP